MLSLDFVCQHPQRVRDALDKRHATHSIDEILELAEERHRLTGQCDELHRSLKHVKEAVRRASDHQRPGLEQHIKRLLKDTHQLELQRADVETRLHLQLLTLPNLPHHSVRDSAEDNRHLTQWGKPPQFHFIPQPHWELGERLHILDKEGGASIAGGSFIVFKGPGARLARALLAFMLDTHTKQHGYTEVMLPHLAKRAIMIGAGHLPTFESQAYACTVDELYLTPAAEVALIGLHKDTLLPASELPRAYTTWATAFTRETGTTSRHTRGLLRLHQSNQVELFQIVEPETSYTVFEHMRHHVEHLLQCLELPYRVIERYAANLPFAAAKTSDLDVWMPSQKDYITVATISNCEDFQARRANITYQLQADEQPAYPHTVTATGLTVERTLAAILEIYQQADGTVVVPKALRPYIGSSLLTSFNA